MIGKASEAVLNRAVKFAHDQNHEFLTVEHVFWSLLHEVDVIAAVRACGGDPEKMKAEVADFVSKESPKNMDEAEAHPVATVAIQRLIQRALFHVQSAGKDEVQPIDLFIALFQANDTQAVHLLKQAEIERLDVIQFVSHGTRKDQEESEEGDEVDDAASASGSAAKKSSDDPLTSFTTNLNQLAENNKIDPLVGRKAELERMVQTLCRRKKNNPLLVGEAGVGKTALAEGLAAMIAFKQVPDQLEKAVVYALDLGSLLAGTKYRGDFEQRLKGVITALKAKAKKGFLPILFIDEIHTIIGAGAVGGGAMDAAHLLKPLLTQGEIRVMGSTTYQEFRNIFEKDHALTRRFQKVEIAEPSIEDTIQILKGLQPHYESFHHVKYSNEAIQLAAELSSKYIKDRFLPDKAIDVMDEAGSKAKIKKLDEINGSQIEDMVSSIARIPPRSVNTSQKSRLQTIERDLKLSIFGQDQAIDAIVNAIRLARAGLRSGEKPIGNFLFAGPTGVGKTELSKQLAHCLGVSFNRFDMSEYGEKHTVSRLIGAPPGYVGFDQAGLLTDAVLKNPHAVVLLDEIEKAHPDIWNILLQVMDHGTLTDNNGRKVDFRNIILILTSNVGSREMERRPLGINSTQGDFKGAQKEIERTFSPEFRNRLDSIVFFNPLSPITIAQVVGKQIVELETQLLVKNVDIEVSEDVREWLGKEGYDRTMGARPMGRLIQEKLKKPLAEEILFGKLEHGGKVRFTLKEGQPAFEVLESRPAPTVPEGASGSSTSRESSVEDREKVHV